MMLTSRAAQLAVMPSAPQRASSELSADQPKIGHAERTRNEVYMTLEETARSGESLEDYTRVYQRNRKLVRYRRKL
jgi:hypothetical protein